VRISGVGGNPIFRFEKWWMEMEGFENLVKETWSKECPSSDPIDRWQFKIFAKAMNNRLLAPNQTTFVKGRFILKSVVSAHEIIHRAVRSKEKGVILKLDYNKAYDRAS
jgi:hypothetical protein